MNHRLNARLPRAQIAMVDALTWDYQSARELAPKVWPQTPIVRSTTFVRATIKLLRRRGIAIETLPGHGYKFAEVRLRSSTDVLA